MINLRTSIAALAGMVAVGLAATPAAAVTFTTFSFVGECDDCRTKALADAGFQPFVLDVPPEIAAAFLGRGTLILQDFTPGLQDEDNFFSFEYASNLVSFSVDRSQDFEFSADFTTLPGFGEALISLTETNDLGGTLTTRLITHADGSWVVDEISGGGCIGGCAPQDDDHGTTYAWSQAAIPEPMSWTLMILGFGLAGTKLRVGRRRGVA